MKTFEPVAPLSDWGLNPDLIFLNNGSFGAPPLTIVKRRQQLLEAIEVNPLDTLIEDYGARLAKLIPLMAKFVGAEPDGFAFVPNATFGANAVLSSFPFTKGGEIVVFPHRYPSVGNAAGWFGPMKGAKVVTTEAPPRLTSSQALIDVYEKAIGPRTELVIVDHLSSLSGIRFPIESIIELCRKKNVPVLVDGAHAPGQVEIHIEKWKPDFYTGNFHKWLYAPRPAAFLYVAPQWREKIHPPIISNHHGSGFRAEFAWCGTFNPTPLYCAEDGLKFHEKLGGAKLACRNHELAAYGGSLLLEALGTDGYYGADSELFAAMFACPLPRTPKADAPTLRRTLLKDYGVEVHFAPLGNQMWLRLSAQAFNSGRDMERFAEAAKKFFKT